MLWRAVTALVNFCVFFGVLAFNESRFEVCPVYRSSQSKKKACRKSLGVWPNPCSSRGVLVALPLLFWRRTSRAPSVRCER